MKKVMIGILILIPILILVIVAAVSNFLKVNAWIGVEDITLIDRTTGQEVESLTVVFPNPNPNERIRNFNDFIDVEIKPDYANRYSIEWRISGDVECMDEGYQASYDKYLEDLEVYNAYVKAYEGYEKQIYDLEEEAIQAQIKLNADIDAIQKLIEDYEIPSYEGEEQIEELKAAAKAAEEERNAKIADCRNKRDALVKPDLEIVEPPATLVGDDGKPVSSNNTGKFVVNSYCRFTVVVQVESITRTFLVTAEGYNVESIELIPVGTTDKEVRVGERLRLDAKFQPRSSIVSETIWTSSDPTVASVDANGVVTGHKAGKVNITVKADKRDETDVYVETSCEIVVKAGASKFGKEFSTSKRSFTLEEIGLGIDDIDIQSCMGCQIGAGVVNISADTAKIVRKGGEVITVHICDENDIAIENADVYQMSNGFVFAVSELPLKLKAVWKDVFKSGEPEGVAWETSRSDVVTVAGGTVTAKGSGLVDVVAKLDGKTTSIILNVRVKLVSMSLRTSDAALQVGLAKETVFAAERFEDASLTSKIANSTYIQIIGAPTRGDGESEASYSYRLREFYRAFNYEVISGGEYAYFADADSVSDFANRLIFKPEALEGKGKQSITVKVSAKYPKYEGDVNLTTATVTIKTIYGIEVSNIAELRKAAVYQKEYAYADGNLQDREVVWELKNTVYPGTERAREDRYRVYNGRHSLKTYAICFAGDARYEDEKNPDGSLLTITDGNSVVIYGDVYGNGYRLSAERNQVEGVQAMLWIAWSNVTVSNLNMRANKLEKDGMLSANDTQGLKGECFQVFSKEEEGYQRNRTVNVTVEYCIVENARRAGQTYNADVTFKGLVVRNVDSTAFYIPCRMTNYIDVDGNWTAFPNYSHINMHNCVFSNCISTIGSYSYERFTIMPKTGHNDDPFNDYTVGQGRFVRDDLEANAEFFRENFIKDHHINTVIKQTGFLDVYNWQDVRNASIIDVGDTTTNQLIGNVAGSVLAINSAFRNASYVSKEENTTYFHVGLISTGISFGEGIMDEPSYLEISFEDSRFGAPIETRKIEVEGNDLAAIGAEALKVMEIKFYCYSNTADITPYSHYEINSDFINRLHS